MPRRRTVCSCPPSQWPRSDTDCGRRRRDLEARFRAFVARGFEQRILTFDLGAADRHADLMAHRRAMGRPMSVPDAEIAAIALAHGMALATRNLADFDPCGLDLINLFAAPVSG